MIVVLSGEGPTDLGQCSNAQFTCEDGDFQMGPMTVLLEQMLEPRLNYSLRDIPGGYQYVSEGALAGRAKAKKNNRSGISLVGKKRDQETAYHYINAWMLAEYAVELEKSRQDKVIAVLFRDCDGTRSSSHALWEDKWKSMMDGFVRADFFNGVPMLPKPKSEVWLLCVAQSAANSCSHLEEISGNDASPNSAKSQLDGVFGVHQSGNSLCEWLEANRTDEEKLSTMPSFLKFRRRLDEVVGNVIH